jgi:hypothetical protein
MSFLRNKKSCPKNPKRTKKLLRKSLKLKKMILITFKRIKEVSKTLKSKLRLSNPRKLKKNLKWKLNKKK